MALEPQHGSRCVGAPPSAAFWRSAFDKFLVRLAYCPVPVIRLTASAFALAPGCPRSAARCHNCSAIRAARRRVAAARKGESADFRLGFESALVVCRVDAGTRRSAGYAEESGAVQCLCAQQGCGTELFQRSCRCRAAGRAWTDRTHGRRGRYRSPMNPARYLFLWPRWPDA